MTAVKLPIYDADGQQVDTYEVDTELFAKQINKQLLHDAVVMYQANLRQGTFASKSRGQVAGTTKKMYKQKGTGRARAGSRRAPQRRGGGHVFAKKPRDFSYRLPIKALRKATRMAIASKIEDEQLVVINELDFDVPKTQRMTAIFRALDLHDSVLVTTAEHDPVIYKSARNIPRVTVQRASDLNALTILTPRHMLVTKAALDWMCRQAEQPLKFGRKVKFGFAQRPETEEPTTQETPPISEAVADQPSTSESEAEATTDPEQETAKPTSEQAPVDQTKNQEEPKDPAPAQESEGTESPQPEKEDS